MTAGRLKLAMVGCGNIARAHWRGIRRIAQRIDVTAVVDTDKARRTAMSERTGATGYASLDEALDAGGFDAALLLLPHDLHEEAAVRCFEAGMHVAMEKPMAPTVEACDRILAAAREAGTVFMIAEQSQYWPDVVRACELLEAGAIGDVIHARAHYLDPYEPDPADPKPWRFQLDRAGGGVCIDGGAHWIRPLRMFLGEVDEVLAVTGRSVEEMEGESWAHALLRFESGCIANFDAHLCPVPIAPTEDFRITGTHGTLVIEAGPKGRLLLFDAEHPEGEEILEGWAGKLDGFGYELDDFASAVLDGAPLRATAEFSLGELRTALAMVRSAESRQWEKVW